ncbi:uncharacterized protein N7511_008043 [Penicillium nucicola]|uniref:uncharacterized protein n=1 Tax=Penicillium nucicola TaxID=1850975 RepID=UPI002545917B|nr:uncharacterized protein N7511_008043 [Penicillium nucicola]KAJ5753890.1 hypothetical protein N7511_008043 [Penicillium nucicola]
MKRSSLYKLCYLVFAATSIKAGLLPPQKEPLALVSLPKSQIQSVPSQENPTFKACTGNTPTTRQQWCEYNIYTDYTITTPDTGVTREFWLEINQATLAPDGRPRWALTINGSLPGPTIEADWGDTVIIHLRNSLPVTIQNGTSLHIHGLRQHYTNPMDGVVSVTQCPIAPGNTMTYKWRAEQYGTTWYHSHIGLQTWEGVFGSVIINGPASSDYDEDVDALLLSDWDINTVDQLWTVAEAGVSPKLDNGLINGVNVFGDDDDPAQMGHRFNTTFIRGKSYRLRVTNTACDTQFKFSIDHHTLTVIAADFVPIQPYNTTVISIAIGQRYDIIVQENQAKTADSFWLRGVPQLSCSSINQDQSNNIHGIIYYNTISAPHSPASLPNTTAYQIPDTCEDEPPSNLIPLISTPLNLTTPTQFYNETLPVSKSLNTNSVWRWFLNGTSMQGNWSHPTLLQLSNTDPNNRDQWNTNDDKTALLALPKPDTWVLVIIETTMAAPHPIHLHGHDFLVVAQGAGDWEWPPTRTDSGPEMGNRNGSGNDNGNTWYHAAGSLPKRDTALLPALGHLVLAFRSDNPGAWLMHCHIGWHLEEGFALQFVERGSEVWDLFHGDGARNGGLSRDLDSDLDWRDYARSSEENCAAWDQYDRRDPIWEDGAAI